MPIRFYCDKCGREITEPSDRRSMDINVDGINWASFILDLAHAEALMKHIEEFMEEAEG